MSKLHFANLSFDEKSSDTLCENEKYLRFCLINIRVHQIFEMQILNHHMPRERVEITKMNFKYFYSVSSA